jgi:two-component system sensor histidine kinase KdpD
MTREQSHELLQVVDEEADRLSGLVTDVIHMARIEPGKVVLHKRLWLPHDIVRAAAAALERSMEGRRFEIDVPEDLPWFEVDRELLQIAFRQLLDNAVRYSPPSEPISVTARAEAGAIVFLVQDHGPGIPEMERKKIFERFYRSGATKQKVQGAGLGLAIVKDIVEAHGGEVWVERALQGGSVFCLSLPLVAGPLP